MWFCPSRSDVKQRSIFGPVAAKVIGTQQKNDWSIAPLGAGDNRQVEPVAGIDDKYNYSKHIAKPRVSV